MKTTFDSNLDCDSCHHSFLRSQMSCVDDMVVCSDCLKDIKDFLLEREEKSKMKFGKGL